MIPRRTKINKKKDIKILNDENLKPKEIIIYWYLQEYGSLSVVNLMIVIDAVCFIGENDKTGDAIEFSLSPENATLNYDEVKLTDDIRPYLFELDSETKKYTISF